MNRKLRAMRLTLVLLLPLQAFSAFIIKKRVGQNINQVLGVEYIEKNVQQPILMKSLPEFLAENHSIPTLYQEWMVPDSYQEKIPSRFLYRERLRFAGAETRSLIKQGPYKNRINITILGDGYTMAEKKKFFEDAKRITEDLFAGQTFRSYLPLFNIYAVFTPSRESGITDRVRKDTVFGLYRSPKGSKRGIIPRKTGEIEKALRLVDFVTDYPIILANDDFYGGLGGRYAITTRSLTSGSMVLRHELGHNFSNVGEEYDGGQVYTGANFSRTKNVKWKHWVKGPLSVNQARALTGEYIWKDLTNTGHEIQFTFPQDQEFYRLRLSTVGWETPEDVIVQLNGKQVPLKGVYTQDRSFLSTDVLKMKPGQYQLKLTSKRGDRNNILAYARAYSYPKNYDFTPNKVGAFNVFNANQRMVGYRPTHQMCLMRDMRSRVFCPVDQENIWLRFLQKVSLIDDLVFDRSQDQVNLTTPNLPDLQINWFVESNGSFQEIPAWRGKKVVEVSNMIGSRLKVKVNLVTPEIRKKSEVTQVEKMISLR